MWHFFVQMQWSEAHKHKKAGQSSMYSECREMHFHGKISITNLHEITEI
jgi:hypothetical protein